MQQTTADFWIDIEAPSNTMSTINDRELVPNMDVNENLLLEAQKESSRTSSKSSHSDSSSPKTPKSPVQTAADWVSFWSSRIEAEPPKEWKFIHPINQNIDNEEEKKIVKKKHLRYVILSNCASFILGMGIMYLCVRRYLRMKTPYFYSLE
ncbi:unnamed protein product [Adineta steineri]|uniref:Uncharacterized protein n=1 Tax=Adineta steineri TaxID=433720 RepID=A0A818U738_9BILA|nr:unnamed protein product [Adineta steineri]CAF3693800.1 unnamed protein product [Adineta steineri]